MDTVELIELFLPDVIWLRAVPGNDPALFGKHLTTLTKRNDFLCRFTDSGKTCLGDMKIDGTIPGRVGGGTKDEPIEVRCLKCNFRFIISRIWWRDAVWEWMRIAFAVGLNELSYHPTWGEDATEKHAICYAGEHRLDSLFPKTEDIDETLKPYTSQLRWRWYPPELPIWPNYGIAIARIPELETPKGLMKFILISAFLMRDLEKTFQQEIKRAATLASSVSERFHPASRRYK